MNFIVTGFPRTGTSAMMAALEAGGMATEYIDAGPIAPKGVTMNPLGNRELWSDMVRHDNLHLYSDRAIKITGIDPDLLGTTRARSKRYRLILMTRPPEEIKASWRLIAGTDYLVLGSVSLKTAVEDHTREMRTMARDAEHVESLTEIVFDDMLDEPTKTFEAIRDAGWPIDSSLAAAVIDPAVRRVRL